MSAIKHFNPTHGSVPYKGLFSNVTVVPEGYELVYVSSQWGVYTPEAP
jgi:hypothetical protein